MERRRVSGEQIVDAYARAVQRRSDPGRADCPGPDALLALVEHQGTEVERLATLDHVMGCVACARDFELLRAVRQTGES